MVEGVGQGCQRCRHVDRWCAETPVGMDTYYLCGRCVVFLVSLFVMVVDVGVFVPHQGAAVPDSRSLSWSFTLLLCFSPSPVRASLVFLPAKSSYEVV